MLPAAIWAALDTALTPMAITSFEGEVLYANAAFRRATRIDQPRHARELFADDGQFERIWPNVRDSRRTHLRPAQCRASLAEQQPVLTRFRADGHSPWQLLIELDADRTAVNSIDARHARLHEQLQMRREGLVLDRMLGAPASAAISDSISGVATRRALDARLGIVWHNSMVRGGTPVSLLLVALTNLDQLSSVPGRADASLRHLADTLLALAGRDSDLVARHAPDSFAVLLAGTDAGGAQRVADRLHASSADASYTVAAGMATLHPGVDNEASTLVQLAEDALRESRAAGASGCVFRQALAGG